MERSSSGFCKVPVDASRMDGTATVSVGFLETTSKVTGVAERVSTATRGFPFWRSKDDVAFPASVSRPFLKEPGEVRLLSGAVLDSGGVGILKGGMRRGGRFRSLR